MLDRSDVCQERLRLMDEYNRATMAYSDAVSVQFSKIGIVLKSEYDALKRATEETRHASIDARNGYRRHIAQHGCEISK